MKICSYGDEKFMEDQYHFYSWRAQNFSNKNYYGSQCRIPCKVDRYTPFVSRSKDTDGAQDFNEIWLASASAYADVSKEMYLYDTAAIFASVGGGIGIFMGFSCYGVFTKAISLLYWNKLYLISSILIKQNLVLQDCSKFCCEFQIKIG